MVSQSGNAMHTSCVMAALAWCLAYIKPYVVAVPRVLTAPVSLTALPVADLPVAVDEQALAPTSSCEPSVSVKGRAFTFLSGIASLKRARHVSGALANTLRSPSECSADPSECSAASLCTSVLSSYLSTNSTAAVSIFSIQDSSVSSGGTSGSCGSRSVAFLSAVNSLKRTRSGSTLY